MTTINETIDAIVLLHRDAAEIEKTLHRHTAAASTDSELHALLHRMGRVVGELRAVLETPVPAAK